MLEPLLIVRIGRTGRIGHRGEATSFYTERDEPLAELLAKTLLETKQEIPDFLQQYLPEGEARENLKFELDSDEIEDEPYPTPAGFSGGAGDDGWGNGGGTSDATTTGGGGWGGNSGADGGNSGADGGNTWGGNGNDGGGNATWENNGGQASW